jgi:hypothetical protein
LAVTAADDPVAPSDASPLGALRQIVIAVDQIGPAAALLRDGLGLPLMFVDEDRWAAFDLGGRTLALAGRGEHPDAGDGVGAGAVITLGVKVPDLAAAVAAITAVGGVCGEIAAGPHELRVSCRHSSGVPLVLYQSLAER